MKANAQPFVLALVGAILVRLAMSGEYLTYVREWARWPLVVSGLILVVLALEQQLNPRRPRDEHAPRAAWLLLAPVAVVLVAAPGPLGSYVAESRANQIPASAAASVPELPSGDPVDLAVTDFVLISMYDSSQPMAGRTIRLTGFVSLGENGSWYVTRLAIICCAADAMPYRVRVLGAPPPPRDTWVQVSGTWQPPPDGRSTEAEPTLVADGVQRVDQPRNPYE